MKIFPYSHLSPIQRIYMRFEKDTSLVEKFSKVFFAFNDFLQKEDFIRTFRFEDNLKLEINEQNGNVDFKILNEERDVIWRKNGMKICNFHSILTDKSLCFCYF
ncbi:MAG: hypothetical protein HC913_21550 [Microscillaceae bacterium]|nr:hypothetical protein [Microscillaceae bacterium]